MSPESFKHKKYLGQHFLQDAGVAHKFVESLSFSASYQTIVEIGPGTGALTELLIQKDTPHELYLVEIDRTLAAYLKHTYPSIQSRILVSDFLTLQLDKLFCGPIAIIGNFPYNHSSQILFKLLAHRSQVQEVVCMVQKEVAERMAAKPGSRAYGAPSVLLQAFYTIEYLFTVTPAQCKPPPKVYSAVVRLQRNRMEQLFCDEATFFKVVKTGFQQRRKKLRNALRPLGLSEDLASLAILEQRAEQLTVADFIALTQVITQLMA
ncbi:MAG: 16S rRNA (adenine(1518)-N(6)/adenine(1519)-N(6))-dimethyltransferase RsmA [Bacteroidota bacterium]